MARNFECKVWNSMKYKKNNSGKMHEKCRENTYIRVMKQFGKRFEQFDEDRNTQIYTNIL